MAVRPSGNAGSQTDNDAVSDISSTAGGNAMAGVEQGGGGTAASSQDIGDFDFAQDNDSDATSKQDQDVTVDVDQMMDAMQDASVSFTFDFGDFDWSFGA